MSKQPMGAPQVGNLSKPDLRDQIQALQDFSAPLEQVDMPPVELFGHGTYVRAVLNPADTLIVGHIHRYACVNLVFGKCRVNSETMGVQEIDGFHMFVSPAGTKRVVYAIDKTIWVTVHANPDNVPKDSDTMGELLTVKSFDEL